MICDVCDDGQRACVCSARQPAMTTAQRAQAALTLLAVVALMDPDETIGSQKVFRFSCPSLAPLFREGESDALYLSDAVKRLLDAEVTP